MPTVAVLDGIRAVAILVVLCAHIGLDHFVPGGFGVTIFFFLSGYLITSLLRAEMENTGSISLIDFYVKRFCRINPPLWATLGFSAMLVGLGILGLQTQFSGLSVVSQFLFFSNYIMPPDVDNGLPITSLWSLAVEEHFYIIFPLLYKCLLGRKPANHALLVIALLLCLFLVVRVYYVLANADFAPNYYWTHTRADSILFGCALGIWQNPILDAGKCYKPSKIHVLVAVVVVVLCGAIHNEVFRQTVRYSLQGLALFVIFSHAIQSNGLLEAVAKLKIIKGIALLSYSIYLCHEVIITYTETKLHFVKLPLRILIELSVMVIYSSGVHYFVERPSQKLRRRLLSLGRCLDRSVR